VSEQDKASLRAAMRARRDAVPMEERAPASMAIEEHLLALPEVERAGTVLTFWSFGSEVATHDLVARLNDDGKQVALPFLVGGVMRAAPFAPGDELIPTPFGPMEPKVRTEMDPGEVDVVIAPGLAFDRSGYRLGYGGGHFDRYLAAVRQDATAVGIAYAFQVIEAVPHGPGDRPVHVVVTEAQILRCRR
jgi:5-formyltetrahydrofolate cyclo-ligase